MNNFTRICACLAFSFAAVAPSFAQTDSIAKAQARARKSSLPRINLHFQTTYIYQYKPAFNAKYSGANSLIPTEEKDNSLTATLYMGVRLWKGAEIYINPELAGGSALSGAFGLGASANGETFRVGNPEPTLYLARGFFAQTFGLDSATEMCEDLPNEIACTRPVNYVRLLVGKLSLGDIFDNNAYANTPRTQFLNWCLMNNGAWDYAANVRGYTYAFAAIVQRNSMAYTAAIAMLPKVANGADLNTDLGQAYALNAEVHKTYSIKSRKGNARLLGFYNNGNMGSYSQAINEAHGTPDLIATRQFGRTKKGLGISIDQEVSSKAGVFFRAGWNDGHNETWAFTEVDRTLSLGAMIKGSAWNRAGDHAAIAVVADGLSPDHRNYLGAGGYGFEIGDGALNYGHETAAEVYYSCKPLDSRSIWFSADYQFILNPGYNKDRGPVNVFSFRLHAEL